MSRGTGVTEGPSGEAAFRTEASKRPVRNTRHPRAANCRTTSSPMPLLAPVTRAIPGVDKSPLIPHYILCGENTGWACPQYDGAGGGWLALLSRWLNRRDLSLLGSATRSVLDFVRTDLRKGVSPSPPGKGRVLARPGLGG